MTNHRFTAGCPDCGFEQEHTGLQGCLKTATEHNRSCREQKPARKRQLQQEALKAHYAASEADGD